MKVDGYENKISKEDPRWSVIYGTIWSIFNTDTYSMKNKDQNGWSYCCGYIDALHGNDGINREGQDFSLAWPDKTFYLLGRMDALGDLGCDVSPE